VLLGHLLDPSSRARAIRHRRGAVISKRPEDPAAARTRALRRGELGRSHALPDAGGSAFRWLAPDGASARRAAPPPSWRAPSWSRRPALHRLCAAQALWGAMVASPRTPFPGVRRLPPNFASISERRRRPPLARQRPAPLDHDGAREGARAAGILPAAQRFPLSSSPPAGTRDCVGRRPGGLRSPEACPSTTRAAARDARSPASRCAARGHRTARARERPPEPRVRALHEEHGFPRARRGDRRGRACLPGERVAPPSSEVPKATLRGRASGARSSAPRCWRRGRVARSTTPSGLAEWLASVDPAACIPSTFTGSRTLAAARHLMLEWDLVWRDCLSPDCRRLLRCPASPPPPPHR
jgi:hypothetical protein